jgi:hypothetical protein
MKPVSLLPSSLYLHPSSGMMLLEAVGDVFDSQAPARPAGSLRLAISASLRFRRVHVVAQLIGSEPELGFEAKVGSGVGGFAGCFACHVDF